MELQAGEMFANRYRLIKKVGRGSFGEVWRVQDEQLDLELALKVYIALDERGIEEFKGEYKTTYALNHPNLLHATYFDVYEKRPYLVMPYCPSSAVNLIENLDETTAWRFVRDVSGGLAYLHEKDIVHRDIKPDNVLIGEDGTFLITDFGVSLKMRSTLRRNSTRQMQQGEMAGTIGYMGPELFGKKPEAVKATDIWALGATLYELLSGELPFMGQGGVMQLHGAETPEIPEGYGNDLQGVLEACMARDSWERPTAEQMHSYAEAKLRGENPAMPWKNQGKGGQTGNPASKEGGDKGMGKQTVPQSGKGQTVPMAEEQGKAGGTVPEAKEGKGRKKTMWIAIALALLLVAGIAGISVQQGKLRRAAQEERERIAFAEKARQDSIANAEAEAQRQAREAEERRQAEEQRKAREEAARREAQEKARQEAEAKAEQERLAEQERQRQEALERQRQEEARRQREAEARRKATSNQIIRVGDVAFEMVYVEGGTFTMGGTSDQGSDAYSDEKPVHSVTLSSFHIGKYEVTQGLWKEVMGSNPSDNKAGDHYPVEDVSWYDCQDFVRKLNDRTGLTFRLPTEAEWEYAARGGRKSRGYKYSGSNSIGNVAWYDDNSGYKTHPVGRKSPNELGLYDMSGNVWEWCQDWKGSYGSSSQADPAGPSSGSYRVLRGGSYINDARNCRVSNRYSCDPGSRFSFSGLRLVLAP